MVGTVPILLRRQSLNRRVSIDMDESFPLQLFYVQVPYQTATNRGRITHETSFAHSQPPNLGSRH
jgi:hypothetical protein